MVRYFQLTPLSTPMNTYTRIALGMVLMLVLAIYAHLPVSDPHSQGLDFLARRKDMDVPLMG